MIKTITFIRFPFESRMGGEELHTVKLAEFFRNKGFKVRLISSCKVLISEFKKLGLEVYEFKPFRAPVTKISMLAFIIKYPWSLFRFKSKFNSDFFQNEACTFLLNIGEKIIFSKYLSKVSSKVVFMEHARIGNFILKNPFLSHLRKVSKLKTIEIVSVSKIMERDLIKAYNQKATIIPNAIYSLKTLRHKTDYKLKKIGYLGRFTEDKGSNLIIKLASKNKDIEFLVSTEKFENSPNNLKCLGYLKGNKLEEFWDQIDLLLLPASKIDPFGLVVLEAMQRKVPVLISNNVGAKDYFKKDLEIFIEDLDKIENKIQDLKSKEKLMQKVALNAFKKISSMTDDKMHQSYLNLFK